MTKFLKKIEKPWFWAILTIITAPPTFWEFSRTCGFRRMLEDHYILHFKVIPAKTNDLISQKNWKILILGHFDHYNCPAHFLRVFPKNPALSLFIPYGSLPSCKISEKSHEPILRTCVTDRRTDTRQWIHRTLFRLRAGGPTMNFELNGDLRFL